CPTAIPPPGPPSHCSTRRQVNQARVTSGTCAGSRPANRRPRAHRRARHRRSATPILEREGIPAAPYLIRSRSGASAPCEGSELLLETRGLHKPVPLRRKGGPYGSTVCRDRLSSSPVGDRVLVR